MISMTGHGRGQARAGDWTATAECFSVNRKGLEIVIHGSTPMPWLEPALREKIQESLNRGRIQLNLNIETVGSSRHHWIDENRAADFLREARALQAKLGLTGEITISEILAAPGVTRPSEPAGEHARSAALAALEKALVGLLATRRKEGATLQKVLAKSASRLATIARKISPLASKVAGRQRESLLRRIEKAGLRLDIEDPRLLAEIAIFAERSDITEELHRTESHLAQFREKLATEGPVGRTLEFLAQELGREFNTMGSKSPDASISSLVIEAKAEIDRIREQLANIE